MRHIVTFAFACLIGLASASSAHALKLRFWVVEQNSLVTQCAVGQYPSKYGRCVFNAYNAGKANPSACSAIVVSFTGVGLASKRLVLNRGYAELDVPSSMLMAAKEPMVHIAVPGSGILFLPDRPEGAPHPQERVDVCKAEMCSTPQELHTYANPANKKAWLGFTLIVPPGACRGAAPAPRSDAPMPKAPAKAPTPLHKSEVVIKL